MPACPGTGSRWTRTSTCSVSAETTAAEFIDLFRRYYGPTMNAFDAAEKSGKVEDLQAQLLALAEEHNASRETRPLDPRDVPEGDGELLGVGRRGAHPP